MNSDKLRIILLWILAITLGATIGAGVTKNLLEKALAEENNTL